MIWNLMIQKNKWQPKKVKWYKNMIKSNTQHSYFEESYNFGSKLVPIRARSKKLWFAKVPRVQTGTVSGLQLGSPKKKSHLDVASARSCRKYYKGEGGGFPRVRAMVSQVSSS
jgi:hypothetical protein